MIYTPELLVWLTPLLEDNEFDLLHHHVRRNRAGRFILKKIEKAKLRYGFSDAELQDFIIRLELLTRLWELEAIAFKLI